MRRPAPAPTAYTLAVVLILKWCPVALLLRFGQLLVMRMVIQVLVDDTTVVPFLFTVNAAADGRVMIVAAAVPGVRRLGRA